MIRVNLRSGETHSFDVSDRSARRTLQCKLDDPWFQEVVTGMAVHVRGEHDPVVFACRRPPGEVVWSVRYERDGDRILEEISCGSNDGGYTLTVYSGGPQVSSRVDLWMGMTRYHRA